MLSFLFLPAENCFRIPFTRLLPFFYKLHIFFISLSFSDYLGVQEGLLFDVALCIPIVEIQVYIWNVLAFEFRRSQFITILLRALEDIIIRVLSNYSVTFLGEVRR